MCVRVHVCVLVVRTCLCVCMCMRVRVPCVRVCAVFHLFDVCVGAAVGECVRVGYRQQQTQARSLRGFLSP